MIARYLIDTSAAARMKLPAVATRLAPLIEAGLVATTAQVDAEALYSARLPAEYEQLWSDRRLAFEYLPTGDEHWQSALGAQRKLASGGRHRAVGMADLLIATVAARSARCRRWCRGFLRGRPRAGDRARASSRVPMPVQYRLRRMSWRRRCFGGDLGVWSRGSHRRPRVILLGQRRGFLLPAARTAHRG